MTEPTEPKFCKDCKHYTPERVLQYSGALRAKCTHPDNLAWSLELGHQYSVATPKEMREERGNYTGPGKHGACGAAGNWFEVKPKKPAPSPIYTYRQEPPDPEPGPEIRRPGWGHPIMLLAYALCLGVVGLVWWLL